MMTKEEAKRIVDVWKNNNILDEQFILTGREIKQLIEAVETLHDERVHDGRAFDY